MKFPKEIQLINENMVISRWADQCKPKHDSNRRSKDLTWVGQNVATLFGHVGTDSELCDRMIDLWYNEVGNEKYFI